jgi:hypothetical protein
MIVGVSASDETRSARRVHRCETVRTILITLGVILALVGFGLFVWSLKISAIDNGSVTVLLSRDRIGPELMSRLRYTSWQEPSSGIRPFVQSPKSFEGCEILRYRKGTRSRWLMRFTYYEAEYRMPDGSLVIGPAFGPLPYTMPNLFVLGPLIVGGLIMLVAGIAARPRKMRESKAC